MGILLNDFDLGNSAATELIKLEPEIKKGQEHDIDQLMVELFRAQGKLSLSKSSLLRAIHRSPSSAKNWMKLSEFLFMNEPFFHKVSFITDCGLLLSSNRNETKNSSAVDVSYYNRCSALTSTTKYKSKIRILKSIRASPNDPQNWLSLGIHLGSYNHKVSNINTNDIAAAENISLSSIRLAESHESSEMLEWARLLHADCIILNYEKINNEKPLLESALRDIDDITTNTQSSNIKQIGFFMLGQVLQIMGDTASALNAFKNSILLGSWSRPWIELGKLYQQLDLFEAAEFCFTYVCKLNPFTPITVEALLENGRGCIRSDQYQKAEEMINEALKIDSTSTAARFLQTAVMIQKKANASKIQKNITLFEESVNPQIIKWILNRQL